MADCNPTEFHAVDELFDAGITHAVLAIGVFDGVHRGHQELLAHLLKMARETHAQPVAMTFHPHPRQLLRKKNPPLLLIPPEEKLRLLCTYGAREAVTLNFTEELSRLEPEEFLKECIFSARVKIHGICVGSKWRFGAFASGDSGFLKHFCGEHEISFDAVEELRDADGVIISSTRIRNAVAAGKINDAAEMLGRHYTLSGVVEKGYRVATEKLAVPTANLAVKDGILPVFGVYAGFFHINGERHPAAVNIGVAPTFRKEYGEIPPRVEIHILNHFKETLYGCSGRLELVSFIRPEKSFDSHDALKKQIALDLGMIEETLKG